MIKRMVPGMVLCLLCVVPALAEDKKEAGPKKPLGNWTRTVNEFTLLFHFKPDAMTISLTKGGNRIEAQADYGLSKDGTVFGRITKVTKTGTDGGPNEGDLFSFHIKVEGTQLTLSELKSSGGTGEEVRQLVEGAFTKKE